MTSERRYQVVIVGGGPVGMALAVDLGLGGVSCAVVERYPRPQRIPKGQGLTQRTLEHFYFWGIADELRAARLLPPGYPIGGVTAYGNLMSDYWFAQAGREVVRQYYFQDNERLPQYLTEDVLRARAAQLPSVTCLFGWTATEVEQDDRGARVRSRAAVVMSRCSKANSWWGATARAPWCASSSVSIAAAPTSTSAWCWPSSAPRAARGSEALPRAHHVPRAAP